MNSVHEPGSRTTSKNRLRNNTESKRIENRPSAQPKASQRPAARPAPYRPPSALPPACACAQLKLARARAPTQRPPAARATPACASARARAPAALRAPARSPCAPQHTRPARPSTRACAPLPSALPFCRRYSDCIVAWLGTVLQYSPALPSPLLLQYNPTGCNTILAPPRFLLCNTKTVLQYYFLSF